MQQSIDGKRPIPLLATLISIVFLASGLYGFTQAIRSDRAINPTNFTGQSSMYVGWSILTFLFMIAGGAFLWRMSRRAFPCMAAALLASVIAKFFFHTVSIRLLSPTMVNELIILNIMVLAYVWWITKRWEATRIPHKLEA